MDRLEFYKELYFKEIEKKEELNNSLATPIGVISATSAIIYYLLITFDFKTNDYVSAAFIILMGFNMVFSVATIYFLINSYGRFKGSYDYAYLPNADSLEEYYQGLLKYYKETNGVKGNADDEFTDYLIQEFCHNASINFNQNRNKIANLYLSKKFLIYLVVTLILTLIPFGINYFSKQEIDKEYKVKIVNIMSEKDKENDKPIKPIPPKSQIIKEGKEVRNSDPLKERFNSNKDKDSTKDSKKE